MKILAKLILGIFALLIIANWVVAFAFLFSEAARLTHHWYAGPLMILSLIAVFALLLWAVTKLDE
jgi:protein-S-isoprenylcysteine O-methyltransferase Ste14